MLIGQSKQIIISCLERFLHLRCVWAFLRITDFEGPLEVAGAIVAEYERRREAVNTGLYLASPARNSRELFYAFPNISGTRMGSTKLANLLLEEAGVALLPGNSFGKFGEGYLRISYANSLENIQKGLEKIKSIVSTVL